MEITYHLASGPNGIGWEHRHNCATAPRTDLLWSFFPGNVGIKEGEDPFETNFEWVPILHFSLSMIAIYESLSKVGDVTGVPRPKSPCRSGGVGRRLS